MKRSKIDSSFTLAELAERVSGSVSGDGSVLITGVAPIEEAGPGQLSFVANIKYQKYIASTGAAALVLDLSTPCESVPALRHERPYLAFAQIIDILYPPERKLAAGIHDSAVIESSATIDRSAGIGPFCLVSDGAKIGADSQLLSSVTVGRNVTIGANCLIYPGVHILENCRIGDNVILHAGVVIGSDGFGFAESDSGARKIQHRGWVHVDDHVEIGANTTVDRGVMGPTRIGLGTKIDNLVQIAHNVQIGRHCLIVAQVGISGSTRIGNGVIIAGQGGIIGHLDIGDGAIIAAQSGVTTSVDPGSTVLGSPARDIRLARRIEASLTRLPELLKRVRALELSREGMD